MTTEQSDPFFIVGCGRSGTTLLRVMLNRHSELAVPLESLFLIDYLRADGRVSVDLLRRLAVREFELREWGLSVEGKHLAGCNSAREIIETLHRIYATEHGKKRWGQKTPRLVRYGPLLKEAWPEARFIFMVRDPRSVVASLTRSNVHRSNALYGARRWVRDCEAGLALERSWPESVLRIRYEDLVKSPAAELERICGFLDVPIEAGLLGDGGGSDPAYGAYYDQIHRRVGDLPDPGRADAWRDELAARDIRVIEAVCGETMSRLDYPPSVGQPDPSPGYLLWLRLQRVPGFLGQLFHYLARRRPYLTCTLNRKVRLGLLRDLADANY